MPSKPPRDIFDVFQNQIDQLKRSVHQLQAVTDFSLPIYNITSDPPPDPVEGMYAINAEDELPYYYFKGTWRRFCDCEPPVAGVLRLYVSYEYMLDTNVANDTLFSSSTESHPAPVDFVARNPSGGLIMTTSYRVREQTPRTNNTETQRGWEPLLDYPWSYPYHTSPGPGSAASTWHTHEHYMDESDTDFSINDTVIVSRLMLPNPPLGFNPLGSGSGEMYWALATATPTHDNVDIWLGRIKVGTTRGGGELLDYDPATAASLSPLITGGFRADRVALEPAPVARPGKSINDNTIHLWATPAQNPNTGLIYNYTLPPA